MTTAEIPLYPFFGPNRLLVFAHDYAAGTVQSRHCHDVPQLLQAARGVMRMSTPEGYWVIPPGRGIWIPAFMPHEVRMTGAVSMRTLYVGAGCPPSAARECSVVVVPPLLQHLLDVLADVDPRQPAPADPRHRAVEDLVLIEVGRLERLRLDVRMPRDARLQRLCLALLEHPSNTDTLDDWAGRIGASTRTVRRLFQEELGMSFAAWRQQARLVEALARLAEGQPIGRVAQALGYVSPSSFIAMFKRAMGVPPRSYTQAPPDAAFDRGARVQ